MIKQTNSAWPPLTIDLYLFSKNEQHATFHEPLSEESLLVVVVRRWNVGVGGTSAAKTSKKRRKWTSKWRGQRQARKVVRKHALGCGRRRFPRVISLPPKWLLSKTKETLRAAELDERPFLQCEPFKNYFVEFLKVGVSPKIGDRWVL